MEGERERWMCEDGWMLQPTQHCKVAQQRILPPTHPQTHSSSVHPTAISTTLHSTGQQRPLHSRAARLPDSAVRYFLTHQGPSLRCMREWGKRQWLRVVQETRAHRSHHFTLQKARKEDIKPTTVMCAKFMLAAEVRINTLDVWRGSMLQLKHMGFWMFPQAVDRCKKGQSHGWEFFLCSRNLPTPSLRAEGEGQRGLARPASTLSRFQEQHSEPHPWAAQPCSQTHVSEKGFYTSHREGVWPFSRVFAGIGFMQMAPRNSSKGWHRKILK